jgi:hypothetical protein
MAEVELQVNFLPPQTGGETPVFRPGDFIQGSVQVTSSEDLNCRHLFARLRWLTEGRGDTDRGLAGEEDLFQGELRAGVPFYQRFHFTAPGEPWSYSGHYVNIVWEVEVSIDLPMARDPRSSARFILAPEARR